ncbi:hypothetical protein [Cytobacillus firmus]|uniref:hypothetical protein n=1 Tax=Cytobacillus firmus TaxID=1399 RepID=UPI00216362B0|nr:hypothetical protein [Cytobacillus firmus]
MFIKKDARIGRKELRDMFDFSLDEVGGEIRTCRINPSDLLNQHKREGDLKITLPFVFLLLLLLVIVLVVLDLLLRLLADRDLHVAADVIRLRLAVLHTHVGSFLSCLRGLSPADMNNSSKIASCQN